MRQIATILLTRVPHSSIKEGPTDTIFGLQRLQYTETQSQTPQLHAALKPTASPITTKPGPNPCPSPSAKPPDRSHLYLYPRLQTLVQPRFPPAPTPTSQPCSPVPQPYTHLHPAAAPPASTF
ncbi:unnamed protein product [Gadus morhua 'NCC']